MNDSFTDRPRQHRSKGIKRPAGNASAAAHPRSPPLPRALVRRCLARGDVTLPAFNIGPRQPGRIAPAEQGHHVSPQIGLVRRPGRLLLWPPASRPAWLLREPDLDQFAYRLGAPLFLSRPSGIGTKPNLRQHLRRRGTSLLGGQLTVPADGEPPGNPGGVSILKHVAPRAARLNADPKALQSVVPRQDISHRGRRQRFYRAFAEVCDSDTPACPVSSG